MFWQLQKRFSWFCVLFLLCQSPALALNPERIEQIIFDLTNRERFQRNLPLLERDDGLSKAARSHSQDMIRRNYFSHTNPDGKSPFDRIAAFAGSRSWGAQGENIAANFGASEEDVARNTVEAWMHSAGHKANILSPEYTHLGVGVAYAPGKSYHSTQNFGHAAGRPTVGPQDKHLNLSLQAVWFEQQLEWMPKLGFEWQCLNLGDFDRWLGLKGTVASNLKLNTASEMLMLHLFDWLSLEAGISQLYRPEANQLTLQYHGGLNLSYGFLRLGTGLDLDFELKQPGLYAETGVTFAF